MRRKIVSIGLCLVMVVAMLMVPAITDSTVGTEQAEALRWMRSNSVTAEGSMMLFRMYNPNSGEHFYTTNVAERNNLYYAGWDYELRWEVYPPGQGSPVYRLYNPNAGDHHYTMNYAEFSNLVSVGWVNEGIAFQAGGPCTVYRQYNPNAVAGSHNYTPSQAENNSLVMAGWYGEGYAWSVLDYEY